MLARKTSQHNQNIDDMIFVIFADYFFIVLEALNNDTKDGWCMTLRSLWQARNDCVSNNKKMDANNIIWTGSNLFCDWSIACG